MSSPSYRGRFAPSPTGPLHPGSLLAAFGSWLLARHAHGHWIVRIEDIDPPRTVPGAAEHQLATLEAFGLVSDLPVQYQSRRDALYRHALDQLLDEGKAFACHCSRTDLASQGGVHQRCAPHAHREHPAVRLRVAPGAVVQFDDGLQGRFIQDVHAQVGDFVLERADGFWAYQLAVVVDDADPGNTDIVRGADLLDSTPRQILLQQALALPTPRYLHLPLLRDAEGHKLSKSMAALPVDASDPLPALRRAWRSLGQPDAALTNAISVAEALELAVRHFDPAMLQATLDDAAPPTDVVHA